MINAKEYVTNEEHEEVLTLVAELSEICEKKISFIIKKMKLKNLKKFNITVESMSLEFHCDDGTFDESQSWIEKKEEEVVLHTHIYLNKVKKNLTNAK